MTREVIGAICTIVKRTVDNDPILSCPRLVLESSMITSMEMDCHRSSGMEKGFVVARNYTRMGLVPLAYVATLDAAANLQLQTEPPAEPAHQVESFGDTGMPGIQGIVRFLHDLRPQCLTRDG